MGSISAFCDAMRWAADSDQVGYSQSDRWGVVFFGDGLYNADCSSLVIQALRYAGFDTGDASYTGDMSVNLCARGWERLRPGVALQAGDILLNDGNHVAAWLGDCLAQASIDENGNIAGGRPGDQTGAEINTRGYYNYPWNAVLRSTESEDDMTDEQIKKLAREIAVAQMEYMANDDSKAIWGAMGKNTGKLYRNNYNLLRFCHDLLININTNVAKIVRKLGA